MLICHARAALPNTLISGPSTADSPNVNNDRWSAWLAQIAATDAVPDIYSWHHIGEGQREPDRAIPDFNSMLTTHNLPQKPIDVNEYATPEEQNPGTSAFWLAQLERYSIRGLRANWGGGAELHDYLGDLIYKDNGVYRPNGDWYLYEYYANMTGDRAATQASDDIRFDAFAVVSGTTAKIIAGTRLTQSQYDLRVSGLSALGLPSEGSVSVRTLRFDWAGKKADNGGPVDLGVSSLSYTGDIVR
jgi:hypothetical protein